MTRLETDINLPFYPLPVVLVTSGTMDRRNVMTAAWTSKVCMEPPILCVAVRRERWTHELITERGCFALNLPTARMVEAVDICGVVSGRDEDKFARCGFTPEAGPGTGTVIIGECPVAFECRVVKNVSLGSHDLFIGEVVTRLVDPELTDARGMAPCHELEPLIYLSPHYATHGEVIGTHGYSKKLRP